MSSLETEYIETLYFEEDPEEIARIRVRFTQIKRNLHKVTTQLEGNINGKWFPLIRYDFDPREKMPLHIQKEYISEDKYF
ncbi:hypothetical protein J4216_05345 [Candidatus Woesearchaeota archaeon]|nr:hypothetical protein [Candidatus Woesearchaeota archaeon]